MWKNEKLWKYFGKFIYNILKILWNTLKILCKTLKILWTYFKILRTTLNILWQNSENTLKIYEKTLKIMKIRWKLWKYYENFENTLKTMKIIWKHRKIFWKYLKIFWTIMKIVWKTARGPCINWIILFIKASACVQGLCSSFSSCLRWVLTNCAMSPDLMAVDFLLALSCHDGTADCSGTMVLGPMCTCRGC